jgi:hypothetical protein
VRRIAILCSLGVLLVVSALVSADLENQQHGSEGGVFTSKPDGVQLVVPRGWRATDQPTYPGILLWMTRAQPEARIVLTADAFTRRFYCRWDAQCRTSHEALEDKYACALGRELAAHHMRVGPVQAGPAAGLPSKWFEYDDGKHFFRQAVAVTEDRAVSLVLSTSSADARAAHTRAFEQVLRTLRVLTPEEQAPVDAAVQIAVDGGVVDGGTLPDAGAQPVARFQSAPAAKIDPVGSCQP